LKIKYVLLEKQTNTEHG